jgi:hypothetical protein
MIVNKKSDTEIEVITEVKTFYTKSDLEKKIQDLQEELNHVNVLLAMFDE